MSSQLRQAQPEKQPPFSFQRLRRPSIFFHFHSILHRPHAITPFSEWPVEYFLFNLLQVFVIDIDICCKSSSFEPSLHLEKSRSSKTG